MENSGPIGCHGCGSTNIRIFYESRYAGFRARCSDCDSNWPES